MIPPKRPTVCNICGGEVEYIPNRKVYGQPMGSGWCYRCKGCGAYVGTHKPRPKEAMGLLADDRMRLGKQFCHQMFDKRWLGAPDKRKARTEAYRWLAGELGIPAEECHFGYFDLEELRRAYRVMRDDQERRYAEMRERSGGA